MNALKVSLTICCLIAGNYCIAQSDECTFDLETQTDKFIREVSEFKNYSWNDKLKDATIALDNGDTIIAHRGGCTHFGVSGKWTLKNNSHDIDEIDYWIEKLIWISERIMSDDDNEILNDLIKEKNYKKVLSNNKLTLDFQNHNYVEWYLVVEIDKDSKVATLETSHYIN